MGKKRPATPTIVVPILSCEAYTMPRLIHYDQTAIETARRQPLVVDALRNCSKIFTVVVYRLLHCLRLEAMGKIASERVSRLVPFVPGPCRLF